MVCYIRYGTTKKLSHNIISLLDKLNVYIKIYIEKIKQVYLLTIVKNH